MVARRADGTGHKHPHHPAGLLEASAWALARRRVAGGHEHLASSNHFRGARLSADETLELTPDRRTD